MLVGIEDTEGARDPVLEEVRLYADFLVFRVKRRKILAGIVARLIGPDGIGPEREDIDVLIELPSGANLRRIPGDIEIRGAAGTEPVDGLVGAGVTEIPGERDKAPVQEGSVMQDVEVLRGGVAPNALVDIQYHVEARGLR